jgi:shikimate dehydrogenase
VTSRAEPGHGHRRAAVLGSPIAHSLSPALHRAAYAALGLDWSYTARECNEEGLERFLDSCGPSWAGLSLTMPLKRAAVELVDTVDTVGREVGGINTVVFDAQGARHGYNTDVEGIVQALREAGVRAPGSVAVAGAGATAASALAALRDLGMADPVGVYARDLGRTAELQAGAQRIGVEVRVRPLEEFGAAAREVDLVVSPLPRGAADLWAEAVAGGGAAVFDVAYGARPSALVDAVAATGRPAVDGVAMLVHQAVAQVRLMSGRTPPVEAMRAAVSRRALAETGRVGTDIRSGSREDREYPGP